ncbi:MAG TPA: glycine--tRNA ligase, partial [Pirellulaceae bacterium]|nr:glycine--tRNA ligase [Pirellulaceae bacterium]
MDKLVSLCKRRGFLFQSSEIYGGLNGFWDYGPLGVELKRNIKDAWWRDMVTGHDDLVAPTGAPEPYEMTGLDCTIIMHPQVWKVSGHFDLFCDFMVDCRESKKRYRVDQIYGRWLDLTAYSVESASQDSTRIYKRLEAMKEKLANDGASLNAYRFFIAVEADDSATGLTATVDRACKLFDIKAKSADALLKWESDDLVKLKSTDDRAYVVGADASTPGTLTEPREFNLMFKTTVGALAGEEGTAFLRPETAQGIFVNFKNVCDSTRVRVPFGIAQVGKSFRNEITPRNFTFRSREFEQMEIEFFCHPNSSREWYRYWRDRRMKWYTDLGL